MLGLLVGLSYTLSFGLTPITNYWIEGANRTKLLWIYCFLVGITYSFAMIVLSSIA